MGGKISSTIELRKLILGAANNGTRYSRSELFRMDFGLEYYTPEAIEQK